MHAYYKSDTSLTLQASYCSVQASYDTLETATTIGDRSHCSSFTPKRTLSLEIKQLTGACCNNWEMLEPVQSQQVSHIL